MAFTIGERIGDYEVVGELGAGGMAKVYKVRNTISQQVQAMKIMLPDLANEADFSERFIREIQVLASLDHSGIARLHTALRIENQLLMIMEFVEGITLEDLQKQGRVPLPDAVDYICQALAALSYAHRKGVIHRDIKPANIMRTSEGTVKLMDFGIAKSSADRKLTRTGKIIGSLYYMSPEQVMGSDLDARSDLYSVGLCLYEIATGSRPFHADSDYELMDAQLRRQPSPPIQVDPNVPQALNDVILRALEKDPAKRFQTAEEFRTALTRVMNGQRSVPATDWLETQGTLSPPAETSALRQTGTPPAITAPLPPPGLPQTPAPRRSHRGFYLAGGAVLAVALVVVVAIELLKPHPNHGPKPGAGGVEGSSQTNNSLVQSLAFPSGDMVLVPGGAALLGQDRHKVLVAPFYIDRTAVTNGVYLKFCNETSHPVPPGAQKAPPDFPVVNITFNDAQQFAKWANKRLPSATEWEKAARGTDGRSYPWGNDPNFELANIPRNKAAAKSAKLAPVTAFPAGASPYGALNMLGNVWQWVDTPAQPPEADFKNYQAMFKDLVPPLSRKDTFYQVRGGSYLYTPDDPGALIWDSSLVPAREHVPTIGFRCARDANP